MKKILATAGAVVMFGGVISLGTGAYAWTKNDITKPIVKNTAYIIRMIDFNSELKIDADRLKRTIESLQESLRDTKSLKAKKALDDLKNQWRDKIRKLDNAAQAREVMLVQMERGNILEQI